jgi:hypothetical protein
MMQRIVALFSVCWLLLTVTPGPAGPLLLIVGSDAISIDDRGAAPPSSNIAIKRQGLAESEPALAGKAIFDDRPPED